MNDLWVCGSAAALWPIMTTTLTQCGRDRIDAILQTIFSNVSSRMKMYEFRSVLKDCFNQQYSGIGSDDGLSVQIIAWRRSGDKPLFEPMKFRLPMHICVTRPQWVNHFHPIIGDCPVPISSPNWYWFVANMMSRNIQKCDFGMK